MFGDGGPESRRQQLRLDLFTRIPEWQPEKRPRLALVWNSVVLLGLLALAGYMTYTSYVERPLVGADGGWKYGIVRIPAKRPGEGEPQASDAPILWHASLHEVAILITREQCSALIILSFSALGCVGLVGLLVSMAKTIKQTNFTDVAMARGLLGRTDQTHQLLVVAVACCYCGSTW